MECGREDGSPAARGIASYPPRPYTHYVKSQDGYRWEGA